MGSEGVRAEISLDVYIAKWMATLDVQVRTVAMPYDPTVPESLTDRDPSAHSVANS